MALAPIEDMTRARASFNSKIPKSSKLATGRGGVTETPLHVRTFGATSQEGLRDHVREKLGRKLGKFSQAIERVSVRFDDVNGPRGGVDTVSRVKVVLSERPSVVVESRGVDARHAFDQASHGAERTVRRSLGRAGMTRGRDAAEGANAATRAARSNIAVIPPNAPPREGSLIGARVGRSAANLARTLAWSNSIDTSAPGVSASDRKAGGGSTAARNVKRSTSRATAALEDSATGKPSRKSTRASANRAKAGSKQGRRAKVRTASPKRAATKSKAGRQRGAPAAR
jgi:ribosome-associated translation inhibitor RaiA